tara:strand:+ start:405 stop:830 length:426 start_codon:yes stop_codon:yes gene_type:complete
MYLFYNTELRYINSVFDTDLSDEDKSGYAPEGCTGLDIQESDFPDGWPCELGDYYIDDSGTILAANTYSEFNNSITLTVGETYTWTAKEDCTIMDTSTDATSSVSSGEEVIFTGTDPGAYLYNLRSKTYKEAFIEIGVSMP